MVGSVEIQPEETKKIMSRLDDIERDGDYKDILAIVELSKTETFTEFKALLKNQETELLKLTPEESKDLKLMTQDQLQETIKELDDQLAVIEDYKVKYYQASESSEQLEGTHTILNSLDRRLVLNSITYYEMMNRHMGGNGFSEETRKVVNDVHYNVEHNLPVRKDVEASHSVLV